MKIARKLLFNPKCSQFSQKLSASIACLLRLFPCLESNTYSAKVVQSAQKTNIDSFQDPLASLQPSGCHLGFLGCCVFATNLLGVDTGEIKLI